MEETKEKTMPSKSIEIKIGENTYLINFPNNGQLIDIERRKINLTDGTHKDMLMSSQLSTQQAYMLVEAITTFTVLIPDLLKDLTVKSLLELTPMQSKGIVNEYIKKYYPWFNKWMEVVNENVE
jgi:hypothetical protein